VAIVMPMKIGSQVLNNYVESMAEILLAILENMFLDS
jgi:hypothetical protein